MDLEKIYFVSQTLAAIGVIISIIYLAIQLRQNTKASKTNAVYTTMSELRSMFELFHTSNNSLARIFAKAAVSTDLDPEEKVLWYTLLYTNFIRIFENSYELMKKGDLDQNNREALEAMLTDVSKMKAFSMYWEDRKHWVSKKFRDYIDNQIIPKQALPNTKIPGVY